MIEEITVKERSELIVSQKTKRTYFTIVDQNGRKLICFDSGLYNEMPVDSLGTYEVTPGKTDQDTPRIERTQEAKVTEKQTGTPQITPQQPAPQELGMWWKELGECLRSGEIDKTTPHGKLLRAAYYAQMFQVLNLKIKKEES